MSATACVVMAVGTWGHFLSGWILRYASLLIDILMLIKGGGSGFVLPSSQKDLAWTDTMTNGVDSSRVVAADTLAFLSGDLQTVVKWLSIPHFRQYLFHAGQFDRPLG